MRIRLSRTIGTLATVVLLLALGLIVVAVAKERGVSAGLSSERRSSASHAAGVAQTQALRSTVTSTIYLPQISGGRPPVDMVLVPAGDSSTRLVIMPASLYW